MSLSLLQLPLVNTPQLNTQLPYEWILGYEWTGWRLQYDWRNQGQSPKATDGQSVSPSWCQVPSGTHDQIFLLVWKLLSSPCGAPSLTRGRVSPLSESYSSNKSFVSIYIWYLQVKTYQRMYAQYIQGLCQSRLSTADYALLLVASATTAV
jgi:hypothetical protein